MLSHIYFMREVIFIKLFRRFSGIFFIFVPAMLIIVYSLCFPAETAASVKKGLLLCTEKAVPSLFTFMAAAKLIAKSGCDVIFSKCKRLLAFFGVSPSGMTVIFTGLVCGYPAGASAAAELCLSGRMSREEAASLLPFTNSAGAAFLVGAVGVKMFGNARLGAVLLAAQTVSSALLLIFSAPRRRACIARAPASESPHCFAATQTLCSAVAESGAALLAISAFITFFSAASDMAAKIIKAPMVSNIFSCICEITGGLDRLSAYFEKAPLPIITLAGATVGFSGLSVMMQVFDRAAHGNIKTSGYFVGKVLCSLMTAGFSAIFYKIVYENNTKIAVLICLFLFLTTIANILCENLLKKGRKIKRYDI